MTCSTCGGGLPANAAFCLNCGIRVVPEPARVVGPVYRPIGIRGLMIVLFLGMVGYWFRYDYAPRALVQIRARQTASVPASVTYRIAGSTGRASLTLENAGGNTEQIDEALVPWERTFDADLSSHFYISAQNTQDAGTIRCEIIVNGTVIERADSEGGHTIASCSGFAP